MQKRCSHLQVNTIRPSFLLQTGQRGFFCLVILGFVCINHDVVVQYYTIDTDSNHASIFKSIGFSFLFNVNLATPSALISLG